MNNLGNIVDHAKQNSNIFKVDRVVERDNQSERVTIVHSNGEQSMSVQVPTGLNQVYTESFNSADFLLEDEIKQAISYVPVQEPLLTKLNFDDESLIPTPAMGKY